MKGLLNTCSRDRYTLIEQSDLNALIEQSQYSSEEQCSKLIDKEIWLVMGSYCHCQQVVTCHGKIGPGKIGPAGPVLEAISGPAGPNLVDQNWSGRTDFGVTDLFFFFFFFLVFTLQLGSRAPL